MYIIIPIATTKICSDKLKKKITVDELKWITKESSTNPKEGRKVEKRGNNNRGNRKK